MPDITTDRFWCRPAGTLLEILASRTTGLSAAEAAERLARHGPNRIADAAPKHLLTKIAKRDLAVALTPLGRMFAFIPIPSLVLVPFAAIVVAYLACAEFAKRYAAR